MNEKLSEKYKKHLELSGNNDVILTEKGIEPLLPGIIQLEEKIKTLEAEKKKCLKKLKNFYR